MKASQLTISPTSCVSSSGVSFGGEWKAFKHLTVHADVTWGLNNIFQKDFDTITFNMYPIYLNLGFGYAFLNKIFSFFVVTRSTFVLMH